VASTTCAPLCETAVAEQVVPALVLLCAAGGARCSTRPFGSRQINPRRLRAAPDTVYDVASLTKAVITSVVTMQLVDRGTVSLDEPVAARLADFRVPTRSR